MKKIVVVIAVVIALVFVISCAKKSTTTDPGPGPTPPAWGTFDFESSLEGWGTPENQSTGFTVSTAHAYSGTHSMDVAASFDSTIASTGRSALVSLTHTVKDMTGKTIYARIYVPSSWPANGSNYGGAKVFTISNTSSYAEGWDYNFYPGQWIEIHQNASQITDPTTVTKMGLNMYVDGGWSGTASSDMFVDLIEVGPAFVEGAYNFATNQTANWQYGGGAVTALSWDNTAEGSTTGCMKVAATFNVVNNQINIQRDLKQHVSFSTSTISCKIKPPADVLAYTGDTDVYKVGIHIQDSVWADSSGGYTSLTTANASGGWVTATWTGVTVANAERIFIQIYKNSAVPTDAAGTGDWYIDDITWN